MSSNSTHINLENYEEYLLLYVDDELTAAEKQMVDAFLLLHPELQIELDILMSTRLPEERYQFPDREALLAPQMKKEDIDEQLLSYIDKELSAEETDSLEKQIGSNAGYAAELAMLLKTKLDPEETIAYPDKQELYRRTRKVVSFRMWMQVAAAVVFVVFVSGLYFSESYKDEPSFANNIMPGTTKMDAVPVTPQVIAPANSHTEEPEAPAQTSIALGKEVSNEVTPVQTLKATSPVKASPENSQPTPATETAFTAEAERNLQPIRVAENTTPELDLKIQQPVVTSSITASYTNQEPRYASSTEEVKTKGSLKGFLRKATRIIEKNTGIGATNDDNELLIGALAVKL